MIEPVRIYFINAGSELYRVLLKARGLLQVIVSGNGLIYCELLFRLKA